VFAVVQITPYMKFADTLGHITIQDSEEEMEFTGYESSYNPETYKTAIRSNVENFYFRKERDLSLSRNMDELHQEVKITLLFRLMRLLYQQVDQLTG